MTSKYIESIEQCMQKWKELIGKELDTPYDNEELIKRVQNMNDNDLTNIICQDELAKWIIYETDRSDTNDWMPFIESYPGHQIRVTYVNVNKNSSNYTNILYLIILGGVQAVFDLCDENGKQISTADEQL